MAAALSDEEFQRMQMQLIELRTKNYTLGEKNVKVQTELLQNNQLIEDLRRELSKCQKVISRSKNAREIEQFVQENEALQQKLQMQEDEFRLQNKTLVQEITSLETSNENLRKELELNKTQGTTFLNQDEKIKWEAENLALKNLIESYEKKKDANSEGDVAVPVEDVELQLKLSTAIEEKRLLQDNMKRMESDYREQLLKMQTESEKMAEKLKKKQESFLILQGEKEQLYNDSKTSIESLQCSKEAEISQLKEHMQSLQLDLKRALQFSEKLSFDEIDMDKDASVELDGEKATFDCSLNESRLSLMTIQDKIQSMTQHLSEAENKIEKLEYEKEMSSGKIQEYENKIAELEESVAEKTKLAEKRKKMMDDMKEHLIETTNKQSVEIENLTRKLADEQEAFKALFDKEKETQVKLIESRNEVQSLKEEVERLRSARCGADDKIRELEEKIQQMIVEHEENLNIKDKKHSEEIEELNNISKSNLEDLTIQLEVVKAEKTEFEDKIKVLQQEAKDSVDERKIQEKKGLSMVKDLKRQLQVERNRAEKLQERLQEVLNEQNRSVEDILQPSSERPKGDASSISSWSYVSGGTAERDNKDVTLHSDASSHSHESPNQELPPTLLETETTSLLAKVAQIQQKSWMLEEKVNHLEMSNEALVDDVLKKTALIQFYCMEGRSDPSSASQDNRGTITLPPNMVRTAVLLKSENGQYQVLNISGAPGSTIPGTSYRLSSVPAGTATVRTVTPQQITVPALKTNQVAVTVPQTIVNTILQPLSNANSQLTSTNTTKSSVIKTGVNGNLTTPLTIQTTTANSQPSTPTQMSPNTAKKKCKNFLSTLIRLADEQPTAVAKSVRNLIQGIIDGTMQAEEFTTKLQKELNSAPQPYLVPFLKKNLPYLRHSLITKELTIEGVRPPPPGAMTLPHPHLQQVQISQKRPLMTPTTQVRLMTGANTQFLQQNQNLLNQRFAAARLPTSTQAKSLLVGKTLVASSVAASSPATVTALQSKFPAMGKYAVLNSVKDAGKRSFSALRDDDDINDVAAMGGVNLIEESQKILASNSELVGTQIRSCKDESFLYSSALQRRIYAIAKKHGLEEVSAEVVNLISHASQIRLKNLIEKLSVIAEHRIENPKISKRVSLATFFTTPISTT